MLVVALLTLGVAACSSAGSPSANGSSSLPQATSIPPASEGAFGSFNACALLPVGALSKIVGGETPAEAMPSAGWVAGQCAWSSPTSGFFVSVGTASSLQKASDPAAPCRTRQR
jgi:hypothetical protein